MDDTLGNGTISEQLGDARSSRIYKTVAILLVLIVIMVSGFVYKILSPRVLTETELRINGAIVFNSPRSLGEFNLINEKGLAVNQELLKGQWSLFFFGFTNCGYICPMTMAELQRFYGMLDESDRRSINIYLVSLDPSRDSPSAMQAYVTGFNENFKGLTGDFVQLRSLAGKVNLPMQKVTQADGSYDIDHGSNIALINPDGHYHGFFKSPIDPAKMKLAYRSIKAVY